MATDITGIRFRFCAAVVVAFLGFTFGTVREAGAEEMTLSEAIAKVAVAPAWVLSAERTGGGIVVAIVSEDGGVARVRIEGGETSEPQPLGGDKARGYAADVLERAGKAPDLAALAARVEGFTRGCRVDEVEVELHRDTAVAEVECSRGSVEVELVFDIRDGTLLGLEVEEEDDEDEDEDEDEEDELELGDDEDDD